MLLDAIYLLENLIPSDMHESQHRNCNEYKVTQ